MSLVQHPPPPQRPGGHVVDMQQRGVESLLQSLERLESAGSKFFDSLAMVGQGPPSLLAAQLVSMAQLCQQMHRDAEGALLLSVPVAAADPVFLATATALPRVTPGAYAAVRSGEELDAWVQRTAAQTGVLFAERRRIAANVQAPLSVPPPEQLSLQ
ncbi:hypothetical protein H4R18_005159 [Coemansia javaensis]|uniref:Uncharacterized protein n=1 Tax=Coemansia javaensis TaxID=2761396 RepID=A0A9W8LFU2_9FUNG|nr:hypothetical protein H4R18_005159 [Coemansia javaensis]